MKFRIGASIPKGNGHSEKIEVTEELTDESEAKEVLWNLLENLGVETWIEEIEDEDE